MNENENECLRKKIASNIGTESICLSCIRFKYATKASIDDGKPSAVKCDDDDGRRRRLLATFR